MAKRKRERPRKGFPRKIHPHKGKSPMCSQCGIGEDLEWGPDPYSKEIDSDYTPVWLCKKCYDERASMV